MSLSRTRRLIGRVVGVACSGALAVGATIGLAASPVHATRVSGFGIGSSAVAVIPPLAYGGVVPATVTLDGSGSFCLELCSIVDWQWNFGDGTTAAGVQASHTYTTSGLFTVTLTVTANNGLTGTATTSVSAYAPTQAKISTTVARGRVPLTVGFDSAGSVTNWDRTLSYVWNFGDGTTATGATATHVYTRAGVFQASLTATDSTGGSQTVGTTIYAQDAMAPPTSLKATSPSKGVVSLTWINRMVAVDHLVIERCSGASCTNFAPVFGVPGTFTTYRDSALRSGTTFRYRVRVFDYLGNTGVSSIVSIKAR